MTLEVAILGAGLAGLALAEACVREGFEPQRVGVFDAVGPGAGASGAIAAILHPLPGRWLELQIGYASAWKDAIRWFEERLARLEGQGRGSFGRKAPMLRPLLAGDEGQAMLEAWESQRWKELEGLESSYLSKEEADGHWPWLRQSQGVIVFHPGLVLRLGGFVAALAEDLRDQGLSMHWPSEIRSVRRTREGLWALQTAEGEREVKRVVFALGSGIRPWFPSLPWQMNGGEVAQVAISSETIGITEPCMISASGYLAPLSGKEWLIGSTFWKDLAPAARSAEAVWADLREKACRIIPAFEAARPVGSWAGVRSVYQTDSRPLVGPVPSLPGLYLCTAFASRGLFWVPWLSSCLAAALYAQTDAFPADAQAFLPTRASSPRLWKLEPQRIQGGSTPHPPRKGFETP